MTEKFRITIEGWNKETEKWENKTRITINEAMARILEEAALSNVVRR